MITVGCGRGTRELSDKWTLKGCGSGESRSVWIYLPTSHDSSRRLAVLNQPLLPICKRRTVMTYFKKSNPVGEDAQAGLIDGTQTEVLTSTFTLPHVTTQGFRTVKARTG